MSLAAPDSLGSKSLILHKRPTTARVQSQACGTEPAATPSQGLGRKPLFHTTTSARACPPQLVFYPFKRTAGKSGLFHWRQTVGVLSQAG